MCAPKTPKVEKIVERQSMVVPDGGNAANVTQEKQRRRRLSAGGAVAASLMGVAPAGTTNVTGV